MIMVCAGMVVGSATMFSPMVMAQSDDGEGEDEGRSRGFDLPFEDPTGFVPEDPDLEASQEFFEGGREGEEQVVGTLFSIITFLKYLAGVIAFVYFTWSAIRMVTAGGDEDQAKEAVEGMKYGGFALLFIPLMEPLITRTLFGGDGFAPGEQLDRENIEGAVLEGKRQILALIDWVKGMVVFLGVGALCFSGWKFLQDIGGEEDMSKQRAVITWIAIGFLVIGVNEVIIDEVLFSVTLSDVVTEENYEVVKAEFTQNTARGIAEFIGVVKYFLQFLAVFAVAIMVYAGFLMVTGGTNEENYEKGKKLLFGAGVGILIVLFSYVLVNSLITGKIL